LDALSDAFWTKGYSGASLDDLAAAAGVTRPTLYAAFGDKQAMYLAVIARVERVMARQLAAALTLDRSLVEGLIAFYDFAMGLHLAGPMQRGCLAICTAPVEAVTSPEVRAALRRVIVLSDVAFEARMAAAQAKGELPTQADVRALAALASGLLHTLAIRARAGGPADELRALMRAGVAALVGGQASRTGARLPD
jgi:AcrR family transcriptional regulator